ncbi:5' nucleotidase, NT5C type [Bacillus siamensis]|uniref:5' nucleotidase, NT5C type n=1 Tax=Bacillus siamensis TaxID=659243 RepID=UPI000646382B|nr:nucleotidase [Bacillus siamensis]
MLRLGIDIDGTVTAQDTFVPYLNRSFHLSITLDDMTDYDLTKLLNITAEEFWEWMNVHEAAIYKEAQLAEFAKQALDGLKEEHRLIYITARRSHLEDVTLDWFANRDVHYDHIELVGSHHKVEAVKKHGIDLFFEDHHGNATMIAKEAGIPVILFDSPYNQLPTDSNIIRVQNWLEAIAWINKNKHSLQHVRS